MKTRMFVGIARSSRRFAPLASRVKDITMVEGSRDNQLVGYGLVVGLAGDGDSNSAATLRSVANILQRYGITVNSSDIKVKNAAAVMVTADIGAFLKAGCTDRRHGGLAWATPRRSRAACSSRLRSWVPTAAPTRWPRARSRSAASSAEPAARRRHRPEESPDRGRHQQRRHR
jgi:hypothetical protein